MGFLPLPSLAGSHPSYLEAYYKILSTHRRSPLSSASSVIILVAPNVDALCASRMLATLFKQDDIAYRIIPVSGRDEMERTINDLRDNSDLLTLMLINMGSYYDLSGTEWFGEFDLRVTIHVIDSARPQSLSNLFSGGENGERIVTWDDGQPDKLAEERKAWEIVKYEPQAGSDEENDEENGSSENEDIGSTASGSPSQKRRRFTSNSPRKRRRPNPGITLDEYEDHQKRIDKYFSSGTSHGQSAASTIYILATLLERADNDFLWFAILGLTFQYITSRISRDTYEAYHAIYYDEVSRLNSNLVTDDVDLLISVGPDDTGVRSTNELRFMLYRHWTLYDAMFHSSYVASKLGIWKERGRQRLTGLLAKMGFSIPQTQQPFPHMDMDLKKTLLKKLNDVAPEHGLVELSYPSFVRCYGFRTQPLSAADAVEGVSALLDAGGGMRMEVEIEGTRNGGEWFGGRRLWEGNHVEKVSKQSRRKTDQGKATNGDLVTREKGMEMLEGHPDEPLWWVKNFWAAYDALTNVTALKESLTLAMSLQRAIIRQGTSIIDKQDIRTMRNHRVVILTQGPDLALFCNPSTLTRLALWLVDALRDRLPGTTFGSRMKKKALPFVLACLNESKARYTVVGIMASVDFGQLRKNQFSLAFLEAQKQSNARVEFNTFDSSVIEIEEKDLKIFLEALCEQTLIMDGSSSMRFQYILNDEK